MGRRVPLEELKAMSMGTGTQPVSEAQYELSTPAEWTHAEGDPSQAAKAPQSQASGEVKAAIEERQAANDELRASSRFDKDIRSAGVSPARIDAMFAKQVPLAFESEQQFLQFKSELTDALNRAGLADAVVGAKGTSTTFYSESPKKPPGHHWDIDPKEPSDFDMNIFSPKLVAQMEKKGMLPNPKYNVFTAATMNAAIPELDRFQQAWSHQLGREVNFVGYPQAYARDASEHVLRGP